MNADGGDDKCSLECRENDRTPNRVCTPPASAYSVGMATPESGSPGKPSLLRVSARGWRTAPLSARVIGSGVFKKPYAVSLQSTSRPGHCSPGTGRRAALLGSLALAEIAVLLPRAGGKLRLLREGYGPWAGFLFGWVEFWIIRSASIAALASVFTESLHAGLERHPEPADQPVLPEWGERSSPSQ